MKCVEELILTVLSLVGGVIEIYLVSVIKPFIKFREIFYNALNQGLRSGLEKHKNKIPEWFSVKVITLFRTACVVPTVILLTWKHTLIPSITVFAANFGEFLDGVVGRFWAEMQKERADTLEAKDKARCSSSDSFEVVTTGSPHSVLSWARLHHNRTYWGFVNALCGKAFVIPVWIALLNYVPTTGRLRLLQYVTLIGLCLAEAASGCIRFKLFFTSSGVPAPVLEGLDFSTSAVKADQISQAKQTFEMVGTALFILPLTRYLGLLFLVLTLPLAYESIRREMEKRDMYVVSNNDQSFDHKILKFWLQSKAMGSKLIIGIPGERKTDQILNACACASVDEVIAEAPEKADLMYLENQGIDFVILLPQQQTAMFVTDEVVNANRCLVLGEDSIARLATTKVEEKND